MIKVILYSIYYAVMLGAPLTLFIIFPDASTFDFTSIVPILITALMIWQAYNYGKQEPKSENEDVKKRQKLYLSCLSQAYIICAPLNFPLVFFLGAWGKSLSLIPFLGAAFLGSFLFKMRDSKENTEENG